MANSREHHKHRGASVEATYRDPRLDRYRGNALIEAFPSLAHEGDFELDDRLTCEVTATPTDGLTADERKEDAEAMETWWSPLPRHLDLYRTLSRTIRQGYVGRNPLTAAYVENLALDGKPIWTPVGRFRSTARGFLVIGHSGVGKTTSFENVLKLYPQVIQHTWYDGRPFVFQQLVWLHVEVPADGSLKAGLLTILQDMEEVLGIPYYKWHRRASKDELLGKVAQLAKLHALGVLVIDDAENLELAKDNEATKLLRYLVQLVNKAGVPVVLIGEPALEQILIGEFGPALGDPQKQEARARTGRTFAAARRAEGNGVKRWLPMNTQEWNLWMASLWDHQWTRPTTPLNDEHKDLLYVLSGGLPDLARKIFMAAQIYLIGQDDETITLESLEDAASQDFPLTHYLLRGHSPEENSKGLPPTDQEGRPPQESASESRDAPPSEPAPAKKRSSSRGKPKPLAQKTVDTPLLPTDISDDDIVDYLDRQGFLAHVDGDLPTD